MSEPFIAEVKIFAGNFAPRNWALCDGQLLSIAQNTALFSLVGTTYGGDGRSTFGLPNLQGRAPMHPGNGPGLTQRNLGQTGGATAVALTAAQMPAHNHTLNASQNATSAAPAPNLGLGLAPMYSVSGTADVMASEAVASTGGNQPHNNMQPYLGLLFIIALSGIFPSRS